MTVGVCDAGVTTDVKADHCPIIGIVLLTMMRMMLLVVHALWGVLVGQMQRWVTFRIG